MREWAVMTDSRIKGGQVDGCAILIAFLLSFLFPFFSKAFGRLLFSYSCWCSKVNVERREMKKKKKKSFLFLFLLNLV